MTLRLCFWRSGYSPAAAISISASSSTAPRSRSPDSHPGQSAASRHWRFRRLSSVLYCRTPWRSCVRPNGPFWRWPSSLRSRRSISASAAGAIRCRQHGDRARDRSGNACQSRWRAELPFPRGEVLSHLPGMVHRLHIAGFRQLHRESLSERFRLFPLGGRILDQLLRRQSSG